MASSAKQLCLVVGTPRGFTRWETASFSFYFMDCQSVFCLSMAFDTIDTGPLANGIVVSSLTLVSGHLFGPSQFWQMWLNLIKFLDSSFKQDEENQVVHKPRGWKRIGSSVSPQFYHQTTNFSHRQNLGLNCSPPKYALSRPPSVPFIFCSSGKSYSQAGLANILQQILQFLHHFSK